MSKAVWAPPRGCSGEARGCPKFKIGSDGGDGPQIVKSPGHSRHHAAILYAFDLIEHDREDMRNRRSLDREAAARLLRNAAARILFNEHLAEDGAQRLHGRLTPYHPAAPEGTIRP
jgi:hypothetical protein